MAPVEPWKKVFVNQAFFETEHGEIACEDCHGGNPEAAAMDLAHQGMIGDPTFPDPTDICGECHEEITEDAKNSLHYTLSTYRPMILKRASKDPETVAKIEQGMKDHCYNCHSSCGQCHVSRPESVDGGLISGHQFSAKPSMTEQCTACHDSGLHSDANGNLHNRYDAANLPRCVTCHPPDEINNDIEQHAVHGDKIQCQVCHSQKYANCSICHIGKDRKGLTYFINPGTKMTLKIGLNPLQSKDRPEKWVLLRRAPANPGLFDFYVRDALTQFNARPTWKYTTPHNIQRKTFRSRACNNCHGQTHLFLTAKDVRFADANRAVIVPEEKIPKKVEEPKKKKKRMKSYF